MNWDWRVVEGNQGLHLWGPEEWEANQSGFRRPMCIPSRIDRESWLPPPIGGEE
jgi:hypothetical protein